VPWWELVILLRKLCLSIVVTLAPRADYKIALAVNVLLVSMFLQTVYTPYCACAALTHRAWARAPSPGWLSVGGRRRGDAVYQKNNQLELLTLGTTVVLLQVRRTRDAPHSASLVGALERSNAVLHGSVERPCELLLLNEVRAVAAGVHHRGC
jgi:hypothetical protein